jgi:hypothetical protein
MCIITFTWFSVFTLEAQLSQWHMMLQWKREVFVATEVIPSMSELCEAQAHATEGLPFPCMLIAIIFVYTMIQNLPKGSSEGHMVPHIPRLVI